MRLRTMFQDDAGEVRERPIYVRNDAIVAADPERGVIYVDGLPGEVHIHKDSMDAVVYTLFDRRY